MERERIIEIVIGVILFILTIAGLSYAWFSQKTQSSNVSGTAGCFDVVYDKGSDIGSSDSPYSLMPTCDYKSGASASVTISMKEGCLTAGKASINLKTNSFTLYDGSNAFDAKTKDVLRYFVTKGSGDSEEEIEGCNGYVNSSTNISLCSITVNNTPVTYNVYLYLDCNTVTTTFIGSSYSGYIQSVAYQDIQ